MLVNSHFSFSSFVFAYFFDSFIAIKCIGEKREIVNPIIQMLSDKRLMKFLHLEVFSLRLSLLSYAFSIKYNYL